MFRTFCEDKATQKGGYIVKVDQFYPSSQLAIVVVIKILIRKIYLLENGFVLIVNISTNYNTSIMSGYSRVVITRIDVRGDRVRLGLCQT